MVLQMEPIHLILLSLVRPGWQTTHLARDHSSLQTTSPATQNLAILPFIQRHANWTLEVLLDLDVEMQLCRRETLVMHLKRMCVMQYVTYMSCNMKVN